MADSLRVWLGKLLIKWGKKLATIQPAPAPPSILPGVMFSIAARTTLEEMLGYERHALALCGDAIRTDQGKSGPVRIIVNDAVPHSLLLGVEDTIGDTGAGMVRELSPLVFTASYKLLDMVFEWTISENGLTCPFQFEKKIRIVNQNTSLQYPDFLGTDPSLRAAFIALYKELTPYRNAITHNRWGRAVNGCLEFDFHRDGKHYQKVVPFEAVLAMGDCAELLATMLVTQLSDVNRTDTLRWLLDRLATFHGQPLFNIGKPRYFEVIRRTVLPALGPVAVDLQQIRSMIQRQASGSPATYDLTVFADATPQPVVWKIPFAQIPVGATLLLDAHWDQCKVGDPNDMKEIQSLIKMLGP
ncbi:MAG: hypothetical protein ACKVP0_14555 [Pirellulaceae bacterium]